MDGAAIISQAFPGLSDTQQGRFDRLGAVYRSLNERVNLISRKDMDNLYERHVLHSLGIAKVAPFGSGSRVLDVGTGGGFPLIPLAILFPECRFHGIDGIGKKIAAVKEVIQVLGLENTTAEQVRSEDHRERYDVLVSRAVAALPKFLQSTKHLFDPKSTKVPRGLLYLKGGDLMDELVPLRGKVQVHELRSHFHGEFFESKKVVAIRM
ncbi:MAG: 16S rRNA (guanine(527)-N(7))-methyltransferase RsmG [Flavobacteriales bacterium]|nr:16S rRNA (guanine(527)-N(7))-methyltransferase RsmG [Flavobacteriales bacterium]